MLILGLAGRLGLHRLRWVIFRGKLEDRWRWNDRIDRIIKNEKQWVAAASQPPLEGRTIGIIPSGIRSLYLCGISSLYFCADLQQKDYSEAGEGDWKDTEGYLHSSILCSGKTTTRNPNTLQTLPRSKPKQWHQCLENFDNIRVEYLFIWVGERIFRSCVVNKKHSNKRRTHFR